MRVMKDVVNKKKLLMLSQAAFSDCLVSELSV